MKRIAFIAFMATLVLVPLGLLAMASQPDPKQSAASGEIIGGFRVLEVAGAAREMNLVVYRGDYVKFND
jgi:hypothetical protein